MARAGRRVGAIGGRQALSDDDTIVALSSGAPPAAIGIIRIGGHAAFAVVGALAGSLPPARQAGLRTLRDGEGDVLDRALVLAFPAAASAIGEDLVELHCHGGRAVVAAVQRAAIAAGARMATAGEFTRRALLNGRIDLAQAQGLADLLDAETETERRLALRAAEGDVSRAIRGWMDRLTDLSAEIEASIEFGEEGDVAAEAASAASVAAGCAALSSEIAAVLAAPTVERWRDGWRIVVAGPPNAGKSTLVNLLAQRDAAIVSAMAGTTRDVIEVGVRRDGVGYVLTDTAGLREAAADMVEAAGIDRARHAASGADLVLWVDDTPPADTFGKVIWVHARADVPGRDGEVPQGAFAVRRDRSATIEGLWGRIALALSDAVPPAIPLHDNQRETCRGVAAALASVEEDPILIAERLRGVRRSLASLLGIDATEGLLDRIFARFCIGK